MVLLLATLEEQTAELMIGTESEVLLYAVLAK
jgi:hypothetical protein